MPPENGASVPVVSFVVTVSSKRIYRNDKKKAKERKSTDTGTTADPNLTQVVPILEHLRSTEAEADALHDFHGNFFFFFILLSIDVIFESVISISFTSSSASTITTVLFVTGKPKSSSSMVSIIC